MLIYEFIIFPRSAESLVRWSGKKHIWLLIILSWEHICQKLSKSVHVFENYSKAKAEKPGHSEKFRECRLTYVGEGELW